MGIFGNKKITLPDPIPGQTYVLKTDDPFEQGKITVLILEVLKGWVRYRFTGVGYPTVTTMEIPRFLGVYRLVR